MRIPVDASALVSLLIPPSKDKPRPIQRLLPSIVSAGGVLLVADETLIEVRATVETKPWFRGKVSTMATEQLFAALGRHAEILPSLAYIPPRRCRDREDDYLLKQTIRFGADILVIGDNDLLALDGAIEGLRILRPRDLLDELTKAS